MHKSEIPGREIFLERMFPRISRKQALWILEAGGCDSKAWEQTAERPVPEFFESLTKREVRLSLEAIQGRLVPVLASTKTRIEFSVPSLGLQLCEIGRYNSHRGHFKEKFCIEAWRETRWRGEGAIAAGVRGPKEEGGVKIDPTCLIPQHERMDLDAEIGNEGEWSSIWPGVWSRRSSYMVKYEASAIPAHSPFWYPDIVPFWDKDVCSVCEWMPQEEAERRYLESLGNKAIKFLTKY